MGKYAMGVDIGGTHVTCQLFDLTNKNNKVENSKVRMPVDGKGRKNDIMDAWVSAVNKTTATVGMDKIAGIGFAMPGPFDYLNGVAWFDETVDKLESLYGTNIRNEILKRLRLPNDFPVRFLNDASCFAIGEAWIGEAARYDRIIALTLGTGFGSTFISDRIPVAGKGGIPADGFLYHVPYKDTVAEKYFSSRWFLKTYKEKSGNEITGVRELATLAKNDPGVLELFDEYGANLGEFLVPWVNCFSAECIVLGGNISKSYPFFRKELEVSFDKNGLSKMIYPSQLDENAALYGSAKLCDHHFYSQLVATEIIK